MGRPKKEVANVDEVVSENTPETVEPATETTEPVKDNPKVTYSVSASFKTRTLDGDRIVHKYKGAGKTVAEALETVVGSDEDLADEYNRPFPKGININVVIVIRTSAGWEYTRSVAPHVARAILENKDAVLATRLFLTK